MIDASATDYAFTNMLYSSTGLLQLWTAPRTMNCFCLPMRRLSASDVQEEPGKLTQHLIKGQFDDLVTDTGEQPLNCSDT